jgi:cytochrome b
MVSSSPRKLAAYPEPRRLQIMTASGAVKVWDPFVRMFHWSLAAAFAVAYFTGGDEQLPVHTLAGYVIGALVALRLVWGLVGPQHARFTSFVRGPGEVWAYVKQLVLFKPPRYLGHNPAGAVMVIALLTLLVLTVASGLMLYGADQHAGPLAQWMAAAPWADEEWLEEIHEVLANLTVFAVVFHVAGVILDSFLHRENLVKAMITGTKESVQQ